MGDAKVVAKQRLSTTNLQLLLYKSMTLRLALPDGINLEPRLDDVSISYLVLGGN